MTPQQVEQEVMRRYPVTDKERSCASERNKREEMRQIARRRLYEQDAKATNSNSEHEEDKSL